jgi:cell division protein FtsW
MLATIAEEFGFVGVVLMLGALGMLVWRLFWLAQGAPTPFAALILTGVGVWIALQTVVNIMMANGTLPPIGIPLPFISSGGSSLIALWMGIGLCQSALAPEAAKEEKKGATSSNRRRHRGTRVSRPRSRPARQGARA